MQRLVGNGMDYDDAASLHAMAEAGVAWSDGACWLGAAKLLLARRAADDGHHVSARTHYWHAAAAFRFAQSPLIQDDERKIAIYRRALEAFSSGAALADPPYEKVAIPFAGSALHGWLMRPASIDRPPAVIIFGGADGWREEYHDGACALLARGVAALLLDGPGQGETRILGGLHLRGDPEAAYSAAVGALRSDARLSGRIGIWGNSLGGCFAARTASRDPRIAACCVNGGTWRPVEILARFPRFIDRFRAMTGAADRDEATAILGSLTLPQNANAISCPLLVLHGVPDPLFSVERAKELAEWAPSSDKNVVLWDDGDHCIYNHTAEKHCLISDWFAARLPA